MKLKQSLLFQNLGNEVVIVPVDEAANILHGIIRVNTTGALIIKSLIDGMTEEMAAMKVVENFTEVSIDQARKAVEYTVSKLREAGLVEE